MKFEFKLRPTPDLWAKVCCQESAYYVLPADWTEYSDGWKTTVFFDYRAFSCKGDPWGETPKGQFYDKILLIKL